MKILFKLSAILLLLIFTTTTLGYFFWYKPKFNHKNADHAFVAKKSSEKAMVLLKMQSKARLLKEFAKKNGYNSSQCFMLDMRIVSGKQRFFVYNFIKDSVELAGLVTHGSGSDSGGKDLYFCNTLNSNCTSLGKYKIGKSYFGKFGLAYKLYGLDNTNSMAFERFVVLHAHSCVPNSETDPLPICQSWGCPTVAPDFLAALKKYIDKSAKPMLLNIYY